MAHAPVFEVIVDEWAGGGASKSAKKTPRTVSATCKACGSKFRATAGPRADERTFASYLGAIHLLCGKCGAQGPVQLRRL